MNLSSSRENSKFGQGLSLLITLFFDRMRNKTLHIISNTAYPFAFQEAVDKVVVALYNISADPEERDELSAKLPDVVAKMQMRVDDYRKSSVRPLYKKNDPDALKTARKNGVWGPWRE